MKVHTYNANGTFTWPDNTTHATVLCVGGGGGGKTAPSLSQAGGGGEGGQLSEIVLYRLGESSLSVVVGLGGTAGSNGGTSKIIQGGVDLCQAVGGTGATSSLGLGATSANNGGNG